MKRLWNWFKSLFEIDKDDLYKKAKDEARRVYNIERKADADVITLHGIPVSLPNKEEELTLLDRLAKYREMYVALYMIRKGNL